MNLQPNRLNRFPTIHVYQGHMKYIQLDFIRTLLCAGVKAKH